MINITCHGYGPCNALLNLVLSILWRSSHLCLSEIFSSTIFLRASSSGFGIREMLALCRELRCASHYDLEMVGACIQFHVLQMCSTVWWSMVVETVGVGYTGSNQVKGGPYLEKNQRISPKVELGLMQRMGLDLSPTLPPCFSMSSYICITGSL